MALRAEPRFFFSPKFSGCELAGVPPPEPFGDMHTEIEYYANNSPPEHLSPAKNSGSSIELNFRDDNWNNDEWIRAQPASKSAELLFRLEHFLVFE